MTTSCKHNTDNILGWSAPHIHINAGHVERVTVELDEMSAYERQMVSIGAGSQVGIVKTSDGWVRL